MKKIIFCLVFVGLLGWRFANSKTGPYSGLYSFSQDANLVLKINDNSTFIIYNVVGKTTELVNGKYTVDNNNITLVPNKENIDKFMTEMLTGKIEGSVIKVTALGGEFIKER